MSTDKRKPKTPTLEVDKRIEEVQELLLQGYRRSQIIQYASDGGEKEPWNVGERTIDTYISRARGKIEKTILPKREHMIKEALYKLDDIYIQSYQMQDYKTCADITAKKAKLMGLNAPEDMNINAKHAVATVSMSDLHKSMEDIFEEKK